MSRDDEMTEAMELDEDSSPTTILAATATGGDPTGKTRGDETSVDPINFVHRNLFEKTVTVAHPYQLVLNYNMATAALATQHDQAKFRLNSIYDCQTTTAYTAYNAAVTTAPTADVADATINLVRLRAYYASFYRYWHVVSAKYKIEVRPLTYYTSATKDGKWEMNIYETGRQQAPVLDAANANVIPWQVRRFHPNLKKHTLLPNHMPTLASHGKFHTSGPSDFFTVYEGHYKVGSINHEVSEDELQQTWHRISEVPPEPEVVQIMIQPHEMNNDGWTVADGAASFQVRFTIEYITQWKDLVSNHEYIAQDTALPAIATVYAQTN